MRRVEFFGTLFSSDDVHFFFAQSLCLSPKTVETYREKLKRKLGLKNAAELVRFAFHTDESPRKADKP